MCNSSNLLEGNTFFKQCASSWLLLKAELWWHQVDKIPHISCVESSLEPYRLSSHRCEGRSVPFFPPSIYLFLSVISFTTNETVWSVVYFLILVQPAGYDRAGLPNQLFPQHLGARCQTRWAVSSLLSPIHLFFPPPLHIHSFPLSSTIFYVSLLILLSCLSFLSSFGDELFKSFHM